MRIFIAFIKDETGATLVEYAVLITVISLGCIAAIKGLAPIISNEFNTVSNNINTTR